LLDAASHLSRPVEYRRLPPIRGEYPVIVAVLIPLGFALLLGAIVAANLIRGAAPLIEYVTVVVPVMLGAICEIAALVLSLIWLYQAWRIVWREEDDYSPELMVGLLLVPLFNLYWMFRAIPDLSAAVQQELKLFPAPRVYATGLGAGRAACILLLIPYGQPVAICLFLAWILIANNAVLRLVRFHDTLGGDRRARADDEGARPAGSNPPASVQ
jgi:hypothetical protein